MRSALGRVSCPLPRDRPHSRRRLRINTDFALFALCGPPHNAKNWLFIGSELAGQRAAIVMSLVQSAKLNKLDPWAYLRDVLARIHSHPASRIHELLPHLWQPR